MNTFFPEAKKKLGFGAMRLQMNGDEVDFDEFSKMIDIFLENGFNYFDTAHGYISGKSEIALRECLVKRYPRESYLLADKLSEGFFKSEEDIVPFFESQLEICGVDYFDFYLMHALSAEYYPKYQKCRAFEICKNLKEQGKIRHVGMSFHDTADVLDKILSEQPVIEFVQLQFNYADFEDERVQSRKCYEVCVKHNKPVIVMEPVKGGKLVNLPNEAAKILDDLGAGSRASYAIRFAASFENVFMVLSGMGNIEMMNDNISFMKNFVPMSEEEYKAIDKVKDILSKLDTIECTKCRYCVDGCPKKILIPDLFACYNYKIQLRSETVNREYAEFTKDNGKALDCVKCGKCEFICPQHLEIRTLLEKVASEFDLGVRA